MLAINIGDIFLYDMRYSVAEGVAIDLSHCLFSVTQTQCKGVKSIEYIIEEIDLVVFSAGSPRTSGQKRIDLLINNAKIACDVAEICLRKKQNIPFFVVSNPVDLISTILKRKFPQLNVFGMGCGLDTMRLRYYIASELHIPVGIVDAFIIGSHDAMMVPLWETAKIGNIDLNTILTEEKKKFLYEQVKNSGDVIVELLGRGSYIAAGVLGAQIINAFFRNTGFIFSIDCYMQDYFGFKDLMISLPCTFNNGLIKIEQSTFSESISSDLLKIAKNIDCVVNKVFVYK